MKEVKGRTVCFGTNYRAAPEVLHGYSESLKGKKNLSGARKGASPPPVHHARAACGALGVTAADLL